jgi:hypothetical protein
MDVDTEREDDYDAGNQIKDSIRNLNSSQGSFPGNQDRNQCNDRRRGID